MIKLAYWYMSFCDPNLPKGKQFLGCCVVKASSLEDAIAVTHTMGINPGGEILAGCLPLHCWSAPSSILNRLLSREEAERWMGPGMPQEKLTKALQEGDERMIVVCASCNAGTCTVH